MRSLAPFLVSSFCSCHSSSCLAVQPTSTFSSSSSFLSCSATTEMHYNREKQEWDKNKTPNAALTHDSALLKKCKKVQRHLLVWGSWLALCHHCTAANIVASETSLFLLICRPISASFLIRTSSQAGSTSSIPKMTNITCGL